MEGMVKDQEEILRLIGQGKKAAEMATILGVSRKRIYKRIGKMDKALVDAARQEAKQEAKRKQQEEILDLIRQGKSKIEMKTILGLSLPTIYSKISEIDKALVDAAEQEAKQGNNGKKMNANTIRKKMNEKEITANDVKEYRFVIDEKYDKVTYEEIVLLVNAYIKTKQTTEAIRFLNTVINNEDLRYLDIEKMKDMKTQVEQIQKQQMARRLIWQDKKTSDIMKLTGLEEEEVVAIRREIEKRLGLQME